MKGWTGAIAALALAGVLLPACTVTYTDRDVERAELLRDAEASDEERRDEEIAEEGGENREYLGQEIDEAVRESDR